MDNNASKPVSTDDFAMKTESVLVTGGTGFIGKQLVAALIANGHSVTVLSRNPQKAVGLFDKKVTAIAQMTELSVEQPIDVIINLAGARILGWRWSTRRKKILYQSRIGVTRSIIQWIANARHKPRLLLSASAVGFYGIQPIGDNRELTETSPPQAIFMSKLCQDWEASACEASSYGTRVYCMRFGVVLGYQGALSMMLLPIKLGIGGRLGSGRQWLSWIHIDDLLKAIAHLMQNSQLESEQAKNFSVYNFTAPQVVSQQQFSETAAKLLHRPCWMVTPALPVKLLLGEQSDLLLQGQRVGCQKLQAQGFKFTYPELKSALTSLL